VRLDIRSISVPFWLVNIIDKYHKYQRKNIDSPYLICYNLAIQGVLCVKFLRPLILILLAALIFSACGSKTAPLATSAAADELVATDTPVAALTESAVQSAPQATSRGDKLEASDPASVKLGAGRPVLVEFFRFT
jgi:hypothetical protein